MDNEYLLQMGGNTNFRWAGSVALSCWNNDYLGHFVAGSKRYFNIGNKGLCVHEHSDIWQMMVHQTGHATFTDKHMQQQKKDTFELFCDA